MEPKQTQIKKLVLTALFVAIATYGGYNIKYILHNYILFRA